MRNMYPEQEFFNGDRLVFTLTFCWLGSRSLHVLYSHAIHGWCNAQAGFGQTWKNLYSKFVLWGGNTDQTFAEPWAAYNGKPSIRLLKKKYAKREYKYVICDLDLFCRNLLYRWSMNQKGKRGNKFSLIWYHLEILLRSGSHCTIYTLCGGSMTCLGKYIPYNWYWTARQISLIHPLNLA